MEKLKYENSLLQNSSHFEQMSHFGPQNDLF